MLYNHQHMDFPMQSDQLEQYVPKSLVYSLLWSFAGDAKMKVRHRFRLSKLLAPPPPPPLPVVISPFPRPPLPPPPPLQIYVFTTLSFLSSVFYEEEKVISNMINSYLFVGMDVLFTCTNFNYCRVKYTDSLIFVLIAFIFSYSLIFVYKDPNLQSL